jgi:hypothetical protein
MKDFYAEDKIREMTQNDKLRWAPRMERLYEMGHLEPYHKEVVGATAKLGEFDLVWTKESYVIEVYYLGMQVTQVMFDKEFLEDIKENGKRTAKLMEGEFIRVIKEV